MALTVVTLNYEYYPDPDKGVPISLGSVFIGKPDLDPSIEANRLPLVVRQESGAEIPILPSQQPLQTGAGGTIKYQGNNVQLLVEGAYSIKVLRSDSTQAYYVANVLNSVPAARSDTIIRYPDIATLRSTGVSTDLTVWLDGHTTFGDNGQGLFHFDSSSSAADDDGVVIELDSTTTGRYIRSIPGAFSTGFYGLKTNGSDNSSQFLAAKAATAEAKYIPPGVYDVQSGDFDGVQFFSYGAVTITTNKTIKVNLLSGARVRLIHTEATGVNAGSSVVGGQNRKLEIDFDDTNLVTIGSSPDYRFVLPAGRWKVSAYAVAQACSSMQIFMNNFTDGKVLASGTSTYAVATANVNAVSRIDDEFIVGSSKEIELVQYIQAASGTTGLGVASSSGQPELYVVVYLENIG